jgi:hypothetical protein
MIHTVRSAHVAAADKLEAKILANIMPILLLTLWRKQAINFRERTAIAYMPSPERSRHKRSRADGRSRLLQCQSS